MKTHSNDSTKGTGSPSAPSRSLTRRIALWTGCVLGALLLLAVLFCAAVTFYLTPQRLADFISRQTEKYVDATVDLSDAQFTLWSTFPHFTLHADSIRITARTFDSITPAQRKALPQDAAFLASASHVDGGINILALLAGRISLRDVNVSGLRVNLVALNDSLSNYDIIRRRSHSAPDIPVISARSLRLTDPKPVTYFSAATGTRAEMRLKETSLRRIGRKGGTYRLDINGLVDARVGKLDLLRGFPFALDGDVSFAFHPFRVRMTDYAIDLGNTHGSLNLALRVGDDLRVNRLDYRLSNFSLQRLLGYLPKDALPALEGIDADLTVDASARLTKPYSYSPSRLPSMEVDFSIPEGEITYNVAGQEPYRLRHLAMTAALIFDGDNPALSRFVLPACDLAADGADLRLSGSVTDILDDPLVEARITGNADMGRLSRQLAYLRPYRLKGTARTDSRG